MKIRSNKIVENSIWLIAESVLTMIISLVIGVISARFLGPSNYGLINRFTPFITMANSICNFGLQSIIIREISRDSSKENISVVMGSTMLFRFVLSAFAMISIVFYGFYVSVSEGRLLFWISIIQSAALLFQSYEILISYFHAVLKSKFIAISTVVTCILIGIWKIYLLASRADVLWFSTSITVQALLLLVLNYLFFYNDFKNKLKVSIKKLKFMVKDGSHMLLASFGILIYGQADRIMIGSMLGNKELGLYTAAYTIATMWYFVPQAVMNSFKSKIFSKNLDDEQYSKNNRLIFLIVVLLGICAGVGFSTIPNLLINILYGKEYIESRSALIILGWVGLFANLGTGVANWLLGRNLQKFYKYFTLIGATTNIVLNSIFIPLYGISGAAIATLISQIIVQLFCPLLFRKTRLVVKEIFLCFKEFPTLYRFLLSALNKE